MLSYTNYRFYAVSNRCLEALDELFAGLHNAATEYK
jgi:hypothetical protein